jgi:hypothetical protein
MRNDFTKEEIYGIIFAHKITYIVNSDTLYETRKIVPIGIDASGLVNELIVNIDIKKANTLDYINIKFNI